MRVINSARFMALGLVLAAGVGFGSQHAEAAKRKPAPTPTPTVAPPPAVVIPRRPTPPLWAQPTMTIPALGANGVRQTINARNTPVQTTWNFRAAYNVAALNCRDVKYDPIVAGYRAFLKKHVAGLSAANRGVDSQFRARHGAGFVRPREAYMTQVYNFYSFPPTLTQFCDAALAMNTQTAAIRVGQVPAFAAVELPKLDAVFENFFRSYEQWRIDAAAWDAKYAALVSRQ